jgi:diguanylate cyclase (GGDEF)-like protein
VTIGVFSESDALAAQLRQRCPGWTFVSEGEARSRSRVTIIDAGSAARFEASSPENLVRVLLFAEDGKANVEARKHGEIRVSRSAFLQWPDEYLGFASDLADTSSHAAKLESEVGYLIEIRTLMSLVEAEAVSERITRTVLGILGLPFGSLFLHDPRLERYVVSFSNDGDNRDTGEFLPGIPADLLQSALSSGSFFAADADMAVMPLQVDQDLIGIIKVPLGAGHHFDQASAMQVTKYLGAVAQVLGNVYQLTRSRDLAMRDDLTKAFNRRFFESYLDEEIERSRRYGSLFSIIFLDLDDLKMVNNFYGHLIGSRTLQEVAKRILSAVRGIDKVVRFGGDEFCIILPQTDQDQAMLVANRVRKSLTGSAIPLDTGIEVAITASFGIASYPVHAITKEDLIRQADQAMYRVKSTTKNAVGIAVVNAPAPQLP